MLAVLAGFVAMLLALALCRVRRILDGSGWRRAEPKSVLGISTVLAANRHAKGSCAACVKRESRRSFRNNEHASLVDNGGGQRQEITTTASR